MKQLLLILLTFTCIGLSAQNTTVLRRITNTSGTIPASDTLVGRVKTDSTDATYKTLRYTGTVNISTLFPNANIGTGGYYWIYIPSDSILARVMSVTQVATDTFKIVVDRTVAGLNNKAAKTVKSKLYAYEYLNDGSANGRANNIVIEPTEKITMPFAWISGTGINWQEPVIINAAGTDFLILEKK